MGLNHTVLEVLPKKGRVAFFLPVVLNFWFAKTKHKGFGLDLKKTG